MGLIGFCMLFFGATHVRMSSWGDEHQLGQFGRMI